MPVRRRQESATGQYHVIVKGINREKIYNQQREKIYFKKIILKYLQKYDVEIHCYCIMSNHAHFIIRAEIKVLSVFMASILAEYAAYYNFKHHRNGHVFQNRFTSECIESDRYYWACIRYIHLNPVKAGMIKKAVRYKYSSMSKYMLGTPEILHEEAIKYYKESFSDFSRFEEFHSQKGVYQSRADVFIDLAEEVAMQQLEAALIIAEDIRREKELLLINQIFEEKKIREEYIIRLRQTLKIAKKRAEGLCIKAMSQIESM